MATRPTKPATMKIIAMPRSEPVAPELLAQGLFGGDSGHDGGADSQRPMWLPSVSLK